MSGKSKAYPSLIKESVAELQELERAQKQARYRDYVRFVRYLKEASSTTQVGAGERIGLKVRQSQVLWQRYKQEGLAGMLTYPFEGTVGKLMSHYGPGELSARCYYAFDSAADC